MPAVAAAPFTAFFILACERQRVPGSYFYRLTRRQNATGINGHRSFLPRGPVREPIALPKSARRAGATESFNAGVKLASVSNCTCDVRERCEHLGMDSRAIACTVALAIAAAAPVVHARGQGRARGHVVPVRFQEMDTNHDGTVQRAEWTGTPASFRTHDWNRDGKLSGEELRVGRGRGNQARPKPGDFESAYQEYDYDDWTAKGFTGLDRNRDNRVTRDEWYFAADSFQLADHDRNGWLSRAEFLSEDPDPLDDDREDRFSNLDADNDGRVARSEWHGAVLLFNALDKNRDGFLTRPEMVGTEPPPDLFTSVDVNGDGNISLPEWHWSRQSFDQRDANNDRQLSQEEFRGAAMPTANTAAAYRAGYDRGLIEGRAAGREDRVVNKYWDLEGQRELETADSGYQPSTGSKDQYQAGYREAFRRAYREGWDRPTNQ